MQPIPSPTPLVSHPTASTAPAAIPFALRVLLITLILLLAGYLRFTGLNWDRTEWIHPDEGHMRVITWSVQLPNDPALYFDTARSPLNPRNNNQVYSYGTLPLFLVRAAGEWLEQGCGDTGGKLNTLLANLLAVKLGAGCRLGTFTVTYSALLGRFFAGLADLGTVFLMYLIGRRLYGDTVGLLAMGFGAATGFMIQQAHFYTVDSIACFFTIMAAYFSVRAGSTPQRSWSIWADLGIAGLAVGFATASKISAALAAGFVALAGLWWLVQMLETGKTTRDRVKSLVWVGFPLAAAAVLSLVAFRIAQPYTFDGPDFWGMRPNAEWLERLTQISEEQSGTVDYPSGRQWANRAPILFPLENMLIWGFGPLLGLAAWLGWAWLGVEVLRGRWQHLVLWGWATGLFLFQATRWVKAMRYFLPLYPLLGIMGAYLLVQFASSSHPVRRRAGQILAWLAVFGALFWGWAVFSIYLRPHPRVAGSEWVYANVPPGSVIANEHWDWGLPLRLGRNPFPDTYTGIEMQHYNEDTLEKRTELLGWLGQADYLVMASNRLYGSIPRLPERYPLTIEYYRALFAGELGFDLVADFTSYPAIGPFYFPDQENPFSLVPAQYQSQTGIAVPFPYAEESFSVYDHPRVLIFKKRTDYSQAKVENLLNAVDLSQAKPWQTPHEATSPLILKAHDWKYYLGGGIVFLLGLLVLSRPGVMAFSKTKPE